MLKECWHRADRVKKCATCGESKALDQFYSYGYVTNQGKASTRYESRCLECARVRRRNSCHANPEYERRKHREWNLANSEKVKSYRAEKQKCPLHKANKAKAQRLRKARCRSGQGDNAAIRAIYAKAMEIERIIASCPVFALPELGYKMHVDHIVALANGGLHHEDNLQILPAGINMRKGAK